MKAPSIWISLFMLVLLGACDTSTKVVDPCGDGFIDPAEECDQTVGENSCQSLGYYNVIGNLRCHADCTFDITECGGRCGDDAVNATDGEECDGIQLSGQSCQSMGYTAGMLTCAADCKLDLSQCVTTCGNSYLEGDETCDDGNRTDGDGCDASCQVEQGWECSNFAPSECEPICQDGQALGDEVCDQSDLRGESCVHLGYYGGALACGSDCTLDREPCIAEGTCGDLIVQTAYGEQCDLGNLNGGTCSMFGLDGGTLACDASCRFDPSGCNPVELNCNDGIDNDQDGLLDCADTDCNNAPGDQGMICETPNERTCDDGFDNDVDGFTDCADPGCLNASGPGGVTCQLAETTCDDGLDSDGDGWVDCDDSDCDGLFGPGGIACESMVDLTGFRVDLYQNGSIRQVVDLSGVYPRHKYLVIVRTASDVAAWSQFFTPPLTEAETENIVFFHSTSDVWQMNGMDDDSARLYDAASVEIDFAQNPNNAISIRQPDGTWLNSLTTTGANDAPSSLPGYTASVYCYQIGEAASNSRLTQYQGNFVMLYIP